MSKIRKFINKIMAKFGFAIIRIDKVDGVCGEITDILSADDATVIMAYTKNSAEDAYTSIFSNDPLNVVMLLLSTLKAVMKSIIDAYYRYGGDADVSENLGRSISAMKIVVGEITEMIAPIFVDMDINSDSDEDNNSIEQFQD